MVMRRCAGFRGVMVAGALLALLTGCGGPSPSVRYYVLTYDNEAAATTAEVSGPRVAVGPITLPGYLDHSRLFIRKGNRVDVQLAEYHQWGEPLSDGVVRVLSSTMSQALSNLGGLALPLRGALSTDWRVSVDIARLDGAPGSEVLLDASWTLFAPGGTMLKQGRFVRRASAGTSLESLVATEGELVTELGTTLAGIVRAEAAKAGRSEDSQTGNNARSRRAR